ncbi:Tetratricopeptide repeat protein [Aquisphaera giovannonii]|uniref:Tetratricopeptide repeat protein n=1 Tax=Aquisphaera giovannonii TaxID=406548 RepID=A0A5B9WCP1_9BACT|nr:tetratricopeptide repeat protein [Aquisphaera giovannonii]QEH38342.1 Tetratricopeptide repeat protein [Aquisphaera giovannonii]
MSAPASISRPAPASASPAEGRRPGRPGWRSRKTRVALSLLALAAVGLGGWLALRPDPLIRAARAAYRARDYRSALIAARARLDRRPDDTDAALLAARCLAKLGRWQQADELYRRAGSLGLDDANDHAYGLVRAGDLPRAFEAYERLLDRWPDDVLALKRQAALLISKADWKRVRRISERLIAIPGGRVAGRTLAGIGFHSTRHAEEAVAAFEEVLRLDPELKEMPLPQRVFWGHLALDLIALGRSSDARAHLERALAREDDAGLRELLGVTFEKEGRMDEAERCWRESLARDPNNADTLLDLGRQEVASRRIDEAIGHLERAAELSPESIDPVYNLSRAYRFKGDLDRARRYEARAEELRRAHPRQGGMGERPPGLEDPAGRGDGMRDPMR